MRKKSFTNDQRGASTWKVLFFLAILGLAINAALKYYIVEYNCASLKNEMRASVFLGQASGGSSAVTMEQARQRITRAVRDNEMPSNTYIDVDSDEGQMYARVAFTAVVHLLPFGLYDYNYVFDETATSTGFLPKATPGK